jgi:glucose/arabinose dehydrogenase
MKRPTANQSLWKPSKVRAFTVLIIGLTISTFIFSSYITHTNNEGLKEAVPPLITLKVEKIDDNLEALTDMAFPENGVMWVTQQNGKIFAIENDKVNPTPILDITDKLVKINNGYEERGLLGIALHPEFKENKKLYLFYSRPSTDKSSNHTGVVAEYRLGANGAIDPNSERIILTVEEPEGNHNGGCLEFGPDGYLYISFGDGGGQHDQHGTIGNGQDLNTWLGKILRIDVNVADTYKVPADNPFVGKANTKPEIWAYGFRNPYRFSFDKVSKQMFAGDVGQDLWEEVDIVKKGANYGWRIVEGTHCHNQENKPDSGCDTSGITMPIDEYSHKVGISVTGGYVYNGKDIPELKGKYFFADWTGPVFYLQKVGSKWERGKIILQNIPENLKITDINEDNNGELYILTNPDTGPGNQNCGIYKIVKN